MTTEDPFAGSSGLPLISFAMKDQYGNLTSKPVGTRIGGKVLSVPKRVQSRDFTSKLADTWPDGNPKMCVVVDMAIGDEPMALWVKDPSQLYKAFTEATAAAGGIPVGPGAMVFVELMGFAKPDADKAPAKIYKVDYTPANQFAASPQSTAPLNGGLPAPEVAKTPEGYTLASLQAAGWTVDQIRASYPVLVPAAAPPPAAAAPPPPPPPAAAPPPPPPGMSEREAKLAAMSPEDRALLGL